MQHVVQLYFKLKIIYHRFLFTTVFTITVYESYTYYRLYIFNQTCNIVKGLKNISLYIWIYDYISCDKTNMYCRTMSMFHIYENLISKFESSENLFIFSFFGCLNNVCFTDKYFYLWWFNINKINIKEIYIFLMNDMIVVV